MTFMKTVPAQGGAMNDRVEQFRQAIAAAGLTPPPEIHDDGAIHRFSTSGKPTHKNGWYMLHTDGIAAGAFGDWCQGFTQNWCSKAHTTMTEAKRTGHRERVKAMQRQQLAAADALKRWTAATACTQHDYLTRKGIQPHAQRPDGRLGAVVMENALLTLSYWLVQSAPYAVAILLGVALKGCV